MSADKEVVVTGIGLITALNELALKESALLSASTSVSATWTKLMAGESAIALRQPFLDLAPGPLAMIGKEPIALRSLTARLAFAAWQDAKIPETDSGFDDVGCGEACGVVVGSSRSHLQAWEAMALQQKQVPGQIEGNWLHALAHDPAILVANILDARGPLLAPMAACATGVWAVAQAAELIRTGQCERVIAGAVESPITRLTLAGFRKMGALAKTGCYPFDVAREGFVLAEGGALMVLESAALAAQRGARVYGQVLGVGITNDSHHVSSFDPSYAMGRRAVELCLMRSGLRVHEVDAAHTHGTSTAQNDRMEASLIYDLLDKQTAVMASKGATGHTLGASGALTVALGLMSLYRQELAPCVGLKEANFDLNFVRSGQAAALRNILCFSFGFGGQNAVLGLGKFE